MASLNILLLSFNHERHLSQAIGSLAAQTYRDFEVVFLDNRSDDRSAELATELLAKSGLAHRIVLADGRANVATNLNRLFGASSAPLISFLAGDDWYSENYVQAMLNASREHPDAGLFYAGGFVFHEEDDRLEPVPTNGHRSGDLYLPLMRREDPMFFVGTCVRRSAFEAVGGFDENLQIEDLDFFVRLAKRFTIERVGEPLVYYRRSTAAISSNIPWMIKGWEQFHAKHRDAEGVDMSWWMAETYRNYAAKALDQGSFALARDLLLRSLRTRPLAPASWRTALYFLRARSRCLVRPLDR